MWVFPLPLGFYLKPRTMTDQALFPFPPCFLTEEGNMTDH
jgi:hypothetical protein